MRLVDLSGRSPSGDDNVTSSEKVAILSSGTVLPYVAFACLGAILFGYHLGVVNGALEYIAKDLGFAKNTTLQGWVVSITLAGATVGSFTGGALSDKLGRRRTFHLDAIPLIVGALISATAKSVQAMIIGRMLAGIGIGITSSLVPLYISEISPTHIRGALGSVNQLFICVGILVALVAGLPLAGNPSWWRGMFGISVIPAILMVLGMAFSPESPRWLFKEGKFAEAETAIQQLWGKGKVEEAMFELRASVGGAMEEDACWFDLLSTRYRKVVSVGTVLYVVAFSLGAGPVPALLLPEMFASRIRAKAIALSLGVHWISNFVVGLSFPSVVGEFGVSSVYLCFASVCFVAAFYVMNNVVETKGRSLEEIELVLATAPYTGV